MVKVTHMLATAQDATWSQELALIKNSELFKKLITNIKERRLAGEIIYPAEKDMFNALKFTPLSEVKVVILGQDPYHQPKQAHGLAFSVLKGCPIPASLRNMYKELQDDLGITPVQHGYLEEWARQGVMLLNTVLTVEDSKPGSHQMFGWQEFTTTVIKSINAKQSPVVFMLWGSFAAQYESLIDTRKHLVLKAAHPSPLSAYRGFFGCKHFSKANNFLTSKNLDPINWQLN